jgi:multiple sugar transport system ATP-binding protein
VAEVEFSDVAKVFPDGTRAVTDFTLQAEDSEFMVLVGPSGCGKTTALRMVAGLEDISEGQIKIGDRVVNEVASRDRDIAMVFQSYALYPHLTVYDNIAFSLRLRKERKDEIDRRVREAARVLDLEPLLDRKPRALSGGQRQRVAMGRAIVRQPAAFLMDEPLSNLDAKLRVQMRAEISKLQRNLGVTTIYVTHDQVEAMTMGDRVAVMHDGVLQQVDKPQVLYDRPANLFVAGFIGSPAMNMVVVELESEDGGFAVQIGESRIAFGEAVAAAHAGLGDRVGGRVVVGIRPEDLEDAAVAGAAKDRPTLSAAVDIREDMGSEVFLHFGVEAEPVRSQELAEAVGAEALETAQDADRSKATPFIARVDRTTRAQEGGEVELLVDTRHLHFFDPESGVGLYGSREASVAGATGPADSGD